MAISTKLSGITAYSTHDMVGKPRLAAVRSEGTRLPAAYYPEGADCGKEPHGAVGVSGFDTLVARSERSPALLLHDII